MENGLAGDLSYTPVWEPDPPTPPHHPVAGSAAYGLAMRACGLGLQPHREVRSGCWSPGHSTEGGQWALRWRFQGRTWGHCAKSSRRLRGTFGACSAHAPPRGQVTYKCPISGHLLSLLILNNVLPPKSDILICSGIFLWKCPLKLLLINRREHEIVSVWCQHRNLTEKTQCKFGGRVPSVNVF